MKQKLVPLLHFQRSLVTLGCKNALKLFACNVMKRDVSIKLKNWFEPILVRGNNSDYHAFYTVFVRKDYPIPPDVHPDVLFDLGANVGYSSLYFSLHFPNCKIVMVEPSSHNFHIMKMNMPASSNIVHVKKAVFSESNHSVSIVGAVGISKKISIDGESHQIDKEDVDTISIIDLFNEHSKLSDIVWLKIDIEGAEGEVFSKGDLSWIARSSLLFIEIHNGCWKVFFDSLAGVYYDGIIAGENLVLRFEEKK